MKANFEWKRSESVNESKYELTRSYRTDESRYELKRSDKANENELKICTRTKVNYSKNMNLKGPIEVKGNMDGIHVIEQSK